MAKLAVNSGSTSLKVLLINDEGKNVSAKWEKEFSQITFKEEDGKKTIVKVRDDYESPMAFQRTIIYFQKERHINSLTDIKSVGYRIVNGGNVFTKPTKVDEEVLKKLKDIDKLSVNHNPIARRTVEAGVKLLPNATHVLCFDTTFHTTNPTYANMYGISMDYYNAGIRKFGFHGISVEYLTKKTAQILGKDPKHFSGIICHLGGGCSITAIENGKSIDHTMGYTPVDGFVMSSRSGSVDPCIVKAIMDFEHCDVDEAINILSTKSGFLGIAGTSDYRKLLEKVNESDNKGKNAELALKLFVYQIQKNIAGFAAILNNIDAIVFTGGIGENDSNLIYRILDTPGFKRLEVLLREKKEGYKEGFLTKEWSPIKVIQVATNEELAIIEILKDF